MNLEYQNLHNKIFYGVVGDSSCLPEGTVRDEMYMHVSPVLWHSTCNLTEELVTQNIWVAVVELTKGHRDNEITV